MSARTSDASPSVASTAGVDVIQAGGTDISGGGIAHTPDGRATRGSNG